MKNLVEIKEVHKSYLKVGEGFSGGRLKVLELSLIHILQSHEGLFCGLQTALVLRGFIFCNEQAV